MPKLGSLNSRVATRLMIGHMMQMIIREIAGDCRAVHPLRHFPLPIVPGKGKIKIRGARQKRQAGGYRMNEKLYRLMNWPEIEAIIYSEEDDPHRLLGPHREGNATVVQAFYPGAVSMELKLPGQKTVEMEQADEAGYYAALVGGKEIESYTLKASLEDGTTEEFEDPYRFGSGHYQRGYGAVCGRNPL